jgi:hypothetical protein
MAEGFSVERWGDDDQGTQPNAAAKPAAGFSVERWGDGAIKTAKGLYKATDAGVAKGIAGLVGLPDTVSNIGAAGIDKATEAISGFLGIDYQRPGTQRGLSDVVTGNKPAPWSPLHGRLPTAEGAQKAIEDQFYQGQPLYTPQNRGERYAHTVGEFASGAIGPGGPLGNLFKFGVLPGVASEAAGEATQGTGYETVARVGAGLLTGGAAAMASRPGTTAQAIRQQLPPGVTPQMVTQAETLMTSAAQQGVTLSWPEALSQVAGRPVLSNVARHLEAAPATEARMAEFYGPRAQQVEQAGRRAMGDIAPPNYQPSTIGPAAGQAAEEAGQHVRQTINQVAEPFYTAAQTHLLDAPTMARVRALPGYEAARDAVRNDPQLARYVAGLPEESVGFLNEVKKQLDHQARNAAAPMGPQGIPNQQRVAGFTRDAEAVRQAGIDASGGAAGPYATALNFEEQARRRFLDPLMQGPIGKIAGRDTPTKNAIDALFPSNPLPNSEREIADAVGRLAQRSPRVAGDLVRAHVESVFNESTQALQSGANQAGGAKFAAVLAGNPQQRANLQAAIEALPNGADRWTGFNRFLEVLEATGTRQNVGSKTAYNTEFLKEASSSGLVGEAVKGAANPWSRFSQGIIEKFERYRLGQNLNELADILTNPAAVGQLRAISRMPANSPQAAAIAWRLTNLVRSGVSTGQPVQQPRQ